MADDTATTEPAAADTATEGPSAPTKVDVTKPIGTPAPKTAEPDGASGKAAPEQDKDKAEPAQAEPTEDSEDLFMDPNDLPPELKGHFKRMQRAYTKRSQTLAEQRQKVEAYDAFAANPTQTLQSLAAQYGYTLSSRDAQAVLEGNEDDGIPETWDDVYQRAEQRIMDKLKPVFSQLHEQRKSQIETTLDEAFPDWREHEDQMATLLQQHPSLVNDPIMLARLAVPQEVQESRAYQRMQKKLEAKTRSARVSGGSTTHRVQDDPIPNDTPTFQDAYLRAKRLMARG